MDNLGAPLTDDNLRSLGCQAKHKKQLLDSYVRHQTAFAKAHASEGLAILASWNCDTPGETQSPLLDKDSAFNTLVLKPRVTVPEKPITSQGTQKNDVNKQQGSTDPKPQPVRSAKPTQDPRVEPKRHKQTTLTLSQVKSSNKKHSRMTEEDQEHAARLEERRARRRTKRAIVDPREHSEDEGEEHSAPEEDERGTRSNAKGKKKSKSKMPSGFALMHGFTATNVGKRRLTVQPASLGVFNRGRASVKARVKEKKSAGAARITFSESDFLNKTQKKRPAWISEVVGILEESNSLEEASSIRSSDFRKKRSATAKPLSTKRRKITKSKRKDYTSSSGSEEEESSIQLYPPAESEIWDIERDDASKLPSGTKEGTVIVHTDTLRWSKPVADTGATGSCPDLDENVATKRQTEVPQACTTKNKAFAARFQPDAHSIAPSDSASMHASHTQLRKGVSAAFETASRYFSQNAGTGLDNLKNTAFAACTDVEPAKVVSTPSDLRLPRLCDNLQVSEEVTRSHDFETAPRLCLSSLPLQDTTRNVADSTPAPEDATSGCNTVYAPSSLNSLEQALLEYEADAQRERYVSQSDRRFPGLNLGHHAMQETWEHLAAEDFAVPDTCYKNFQDDHLSFADFEAAVVGRDEEPSPYDTPDHAWSAGDEPAQYYESNGAHYDSEHFALGFNEPIFEDATRRYDISEQAPCPWPQQVCCGAEGAWGHGEHEGDQVLFEDSQYDMMQLGEQFWGCASAEDAAAANFEPGNVWRTQGSSSVVPQSFSDTTSDTEENEMMATGRFSQGRALLLGFRCESERRRRAAGTASALSRAEKDVARALRGHWRPLKL